MRLSLTEQNRARPVARGAWRLLTALTVTFALLAPVAAQETDVETVLANITEAAQALEDASFLLTGKLINTDGTTITLEVDIMIVPAEPVANAYIFQPDVLADDMIILHGDTVYNYMFLTNQVMVFDADDPDALGGLLPTGDDGATANISFDLSEVFAGFVASVTELFSGPYGETYRLHFANKDPSALILEVEALVPTADWLPRQLTFMREGGQLLAELNAEELVINVGLDPHELLQLPADVEVIDNRR